jgi:DNA replication protein DnaD
MARPQKDGLDYFPHDVYASNDEKIEPLLLIYGAKGYSFYFIHLEYIYRNSDLEFDISDAETREVIQQKLHINSEEYKNILESVFKKKLFDENYYKETGKLTSKGIKKRAGIVFEKRKKMRVAYEKRISGGVSAAETTHIKKRKEKKSKVKESNINIQQQQQETPEGKIFLFFNQNIGPISPFQADVISTHLDEKMDPEMILQILKEGIGKQEPWTWINKVLSNSSLRGITTLVQYISEKDKKESRKGGGGSAGYKNCDAGGDSEPIEGLGIIV